MIYLAEVDIYCFGLLKKDIFLFVVSFLYSLSLSIN